MAPAEARGALPGWISVLGWGLALCSLCGAGPLWSGSHEWKKLILTQHWPPTVCKEVNSCQDSLDYWTIHGLWQASNTVKLMKQSGKTSLSPVAISRTVKFGRSFSS
uniref:Uncharacterized protein n=1 Tax=Mus musculus TaxID=10090 RepID=Q9D505_MOUSE|nr:unnamed protein product [Mus musculus]